jgi:peptide/nickel transport system substrate-binding protein
VYPYSLVAFRKALSYALDRQKIYAIGEYGDEPPSDAIGIANQFPTWADPRLTAQAKDLATYNPTTSRALLTKAGFTWKSGQLYDPKGHKVSFQLSVIGGWTDNVLDMQIIQQNLQAIGIDASLKLFDQNSWFDKADKGLLAAHLHWLGDGPTPYYYFYSYMSKESYVPTGQDASVNGQNNWERWYSPEATALLAQFRQTTDQATQKALVDKLQQIQLAQFPYIPLIYGAIWYTYSTKHFTGWPDQHNYYTIGSVNNYPDFLKAWASLKPVT